MNWSELVLLGLVFFYPKLRAFWSRNVQFNGFTNVRAPKASTGIALVLLLILFTFLSFQSINWPENVFREVGARPQTPTSVIRNRLSRLRPLTASDEVIFTWLESKEGRILYDRHGPTVLSNCNWCSVNHPTSFDLYTLSSRLWAYFGTSIALVALAFVASDRYTSFISYTAVLVAVITLGCESYARYMAVQSGPFTSMTHGPGNWLMFEQLHFGSYIGMSLAVFTETLLICILETNIVAGKTQNMLEYPQDVLNSLQQSIARLHANTALLGIQRTDEKLSETSDKYWDAARSERKGSLEQDHAKRQRQQLKQAMDVERTRKEVRAHVDQILGSS